MTTPVLDWRPRFDERSLRFTVAEHFSTDKPLRTRTRSHWGLYLDQGREGACVGFGTANALAVTPRRVKPVTNALARSIYQQAQTIDEWEGEDYEGTSVLAGMKVARDRGFVTSYYWATSLKQAQHAVASNIGALTIGVWWYSGMFDSDEHGFIRPTGSRAGGHCVALTGIDMKREAFIVQNSWGKDWGGRGGAQPGQAFLDFTSAERLLIAEGGEAALMRKAS